MVIIKYASLWHTLEQMWAVPYYHACSLFLQKKDTKRMRYNKI